jgi:nucleoside-diphosphate-sugar epimerase
MTRGPRRILLTGHAGYIGSVMTPMLVARGYDVVGLDTGYFETCNLVAAPGAIPVIHRDLRDVTMEDLRGFDGVIHLAALSNDPIGNLSERWTAEINEQGSIRLAQLAREAGVERFLFSSSCIMYGVSSNDFVDETAPLSPQTVYARSKVLAEQGIGALATEGFAPTFLRNGTVYGLSPRMRFDTVLNNLVGMAATTGRIVVHSDGTPWRPVVHVEDVCRAFMAILEAPIDLVRNEAFNVGTDELNHQVIDLARWAVDAVPGAELELRASPDADQRTYRTDFGKFKRAFPEFRWEWNAAAGARDLAARFADVGLTADLFNSPRFTRLRWLRQLIDGGQLDHDLRWNDEVARANAALVVANDGGTA